MYTSKEINDYVNNHDPDTLHMSLEEFTQHRKHGPDGKTTNTYTTAETQSRACEEYSYSSTPLRTKIPGRNSMLFDPGSRINIIGATAAKEFAGSASGYGEVKYHERDNTLRINGVGSGSTPCTHVGFFPIACRHKGGGRHAQRSVYSQYRLWTFGGPFAGDTWTCLSLRQGCGDGFQTRSRTGHSTMGRRIQDHVRQDCEDTAHG